MSTAGKKGGKKAATTAVATPAVAAAAPAAPSADAMLSLLGSRIDLLEGSSSDSATLTADEQALVAQTMGALRTRMDEESESGQVEVRDQLSALFELHRSEVEARVLAERQRDSATERLQRALKQKASLESLCKELQSRNRTLADEVRVVAAAQARAHADMKSSFERNLADIQSQLNRHTEDRLSQASENEKLRSQLSSLLSFDGVREEHCAQQIKTKDLEAKLLEARLAQQADFAAMEAKKAQGQQEKIAFLSQMESQLRAQLSGYATKFEQVQLTLTKSNESFSMFKSQMERTAAAMKQLEKDKGALEKKAAQSQLSIIQMFEERQQDEAAMQKLRRQNEVLTNLCKQQQAKLPVAAASASAVTEEEKEPTETTEEIVAQEPEA